jgi:hypothetical protein
MNHDSSQQRVKENMYIHRSNMKTANLSVPFLCRGHQLKEVSLKVDERVVDWSNRLTKVDCLTKFQAAIPNQKTKI